MIYYITGINARLIKLDDLKKDFDSVRVYDANIQDEYDNFLEDISNVSIFPTNDLVILKRCEKLKNIKDLIEYLKLHKDENKSIAIDYFFEYKGKNPYVKEFKALDAQIFNIEETKDLVIDYVKENLGVSKVEAKKILSYIGEDYVHVKNEVFKYKSALNGKYDFEVVKSLMLENQEKKINEYLSEIYEGKFNLDKVNNKYYIPLIYAIYNDFLIFHKLNILNLSKNYEEFRKIYDEFEKYFKANYYVIFLKNKALKFDKNKCIEVLKKCNEMENKIKQGLIDEKLALWFVISEIQK